MSGRDPMPPDDEALSALLDGALPAAQEQRLRERLALEPALRARLAELQGANAAVRNAYCGFANEPLPPRVLELLGSAGLDSRTGGGDVVALRTPRARPVFSWPLAAAASVALTIGVLVGTLIGLRPASESIEGLVAVASPVGAQTQLHRVLESLASGETATLGTGVAATPRLTFATTDGRHCREVDLTSGDRTAATLACRSGSAWQVEAVTFATRPGTGVYRPAAGSAVLDAAVDALIEGEPLTADAERTLIARGWR
jgi:hypothetical protein